MAKIYLRGRYWWISYSVGGRRFRKPTKILAADKPLAKRYLDSVQGELARGHIGWETRGPNVSTAATAWLNSIKANRSFQTHRRYRQHLHNFLSHLAKRFPDLVRLSQVTPAVVQDYVTHRGGHPSTVRSAAALLSSWFSWCVNMRYLSSNPAAKTMKPRPVASEIHYFTPDQMAAILASAGVRRPFYEFLYRSFARVGEAVHFRRKQVDLERGVLIFPAESSKARRHDEIELSSKLRAVLEPICQGKKPDDLLFLPEICVHRNTLLNEFKAILKSLGLSGNLHSLRHTGISHLVMPPDPVPLAIVKDLARHRDIKTTLKYAHLSPEIARGGYINRLPL